jgi:serpin B
MSFSRALAAAAAVAAALAAGCGTQPAPRPALPGELRGVATIEPPASPAPYAAGDVQFGLDLLHAWCQQQPAGDLVLSPASLASGLGMAYLGARGATAAAMAQVLHLPATGQLAAGLQTRSRALRGLDNRGVSVAASDRVWTDPRLLPRRSYLDAVATGYDAGVGRVPLLTDPARSAALIDAAVAAATGGQITRLVSADQLVNVIFVLTDALYLNARWATPFLPANTSSGPFTTAAGSKVTARYMFGTGYSDATAQGWSAVRLPYRGGRLAMTALLPPAATGGSCPDLGAGVLRRLDQALARPPGQRTAAIQLPEVTLRTQQNLNELLTKLGMGIAFTPQADFTGISPAAGSIGTVEHAATLRVDTAGTVASAATAVTILPASGWAGPTVTFTRPYLILITDTQTGEPLFLARVASPAMP